MGLSQLPIDRIEGEDRSQSTLFPEHLDDYIAEDNGTGHRRVRR